MGRAGNSLVYSEQFWSGHGTRRALYGSLNGAVNRLWRGRFNMRRREFITLLGGAAAWPLAARAQEPGRRPKLGIVYLGPVAMAGPRVEALLNGLRAAGYGGPEQIEIVLRTTDGDPARITPLDRKSTRLNSSHLGISYAVFCLKKKKKK